MRRWKIGWLQKSFYTLYMVFDICIFKICDHSRMCIYAQSILPMMLRGNMYLIVCYLEEMFRGWCLRIRSTTSDVGCLQKDFCTPFPSHLPAPQALASQLASVAIDPRLENNLVAASDGPERKAMEEPMLSEKSPCSWPFELSNINNELQICHNLISWNHTEKVMYDNSPSPENMSAYIWVSPILNHPKPVVSLVRLKKIVPWLPILKLDQLPSLDLEYI